MTSRAVYLFATILLIIMSLGCGSGYTTTPTISATAHPLVAQYSIPHVQDGTTAWVEFGPDTNYGRQTSIMTPSATAGGFGTFEILVAGMKANTTYHMRAHVDGAGGPWVDQDRTFTTGALPSSITPPKFTVTNPTPGLHPAPGVELLSMVSQTNNLGLVTDLQGNLIWYCPQSAAPLKPMDSGHFILNLGTDLQEVDLACNVLRDVSVDQINQSLQANGYSFVIPGALGLPGGGQLHHDMLVLPNGHWIALCQIARNFTDLPGYPGTIQVAGDALVDIDLNGNVVWAWSAFDHLDVNRHLEGLPDWTHSNALVYTADGNLLLSMRHQSWILKIDYANGGGTGDIIWKLGQDGDFNIAGGDPSQWFYAQHFPALLNTNGSLMTLGVFDNGNLRVDSSGNACYPVPFPAVCYSRAAIFQVDESTKLATLLWQDLPGVFSFWGGSIGTFSNGDVEFDMSEPTVTTASQITEVTQTSTPQIVWQMNTSGGNAYRGYRIPSLYPGVTWKQ